MTPEQIQQYRDLLAAGRFDPDKRSDQYPYQRGVNEGLRSAEEYLARVLNEGKAA